MREDYHTFKFTRISSASLTGSPFTRNHPPLKALLDNMYGVDVVCQISLKIKKEAMSFTEGNRYHRLVEKKECGEYYICR